SRWPPFLVSKRLNGIRPSEYLTKEPPRGFRQKRGRFRRVAPLSVSLDVRGTRHDLDAATTLALARDQDTAQLSDTTRVRRPLIPKNHAGGRRGYLWSASGLHHPDRRRKELDVFSEACRPVDGQLEKVAFDEVSGAGVWIGPRHPIQRVREKPFA